MSVSGVRQTPKSWLFIVRVVKNLLFEKFDFRSDFVNFGIHFGSILGALGHHFATFGRSVATLVGRMADASTWVKIGSEWGGGGGGDPVHFRPVPTPSRTLPLSRVGIYRVVIQGRYMEGR